MVGVSSALSLFAYADKVKKDTLRDRCGYRMSALAAPFPDMVPYVQALVAERPDRLVWASDWPHVSFKGVMPNTTDLLDQMLHWVPSEEMRNRILVDNPAALYGF